MHTLTSLMNCVLTSSPTLAPIYLLNHDTTLTLTYSINFNPTYLRYITPKSSPTIASKYPLTLAPASSTNFSIALASPLDIPTFSKTLSLAYYSTLNIIYLVPINLTSSMNLVLDYSPTLSPTYYPTLTMTLSPY